MTGRMRTGRVFGLSAAALLAVAFTSTSALGQPRRNDDRKNDGPRQAQPAPVRAGQPRQQQAAPPPRAERPQPVRAGQPRPGVSAPPPTRAPAPAPKVVQIPPRAPAASPQPSRAQPQVITRAPSPAPKAAAPAQPPTRSLGVQPSRGAPTRDARPGVIVRAPSAPAPTPRQDPAPPKSAGTPRQTPAQTQAPTRPLGVQRRDQVTPAPAPKRALGVERRDQPASLSPAPTRPLGVQRRDQPVTTGRTTPTAPTPGTIPPRAGLGGPSTSAPTLGSTDRQRFERPLGIAPATPPTLAPTNVVVDERRFHHDRRDRWRGSGHHHHGGGGGHSSSGIFIGVNFGFGYGSPFFASLGWRQGWGHSHWHGHGHHWAHGHWDPFWSPTCWWPRPVHIHHRPTFCSSWDWGWDPWYCRPAFSTCGLVSINCWDPAPSWYVTRHSVCATTVFTTPTVVYTTPVVEQSPFFVASAEPLPTPASEAELLTTSDRELGDTYFRLGDAANAIRVYAEHLAKHPGDSGAARSMGLAMIASGDVGAGLDQVLKAYRIDPTLGDRPIRKDLFGSEAEFKRVLDLTTRTAAGSNTAAAWLGASVMLQADGSIGPARAALDQARAATPALDDRVFDWMKGVLPQP